MIKRWLRKAFQEGYNLSCEHHRQRMQALEAALVDASGHIEQERRDAVALRCYIDALEARLYRNGLTPPCFHACQREVLH